QHSVDFSQLCDVFNRLSTEIKTLSVKFEGSKHVDSSITSMFSVPSSYSIKTSSSGEIPDPASAEEIIKNVPEFINDPKSANSLNSFSFGHLTEEQFRCLIFISELLTTPLLPLRTRLLKRMEEHPNVTLREMVRREVKIANLARDSALINFDIVSTHLVQKINVSMTHSAQFVTQPNPSTEQKPFSPCPFCRPGHFSQECPFKVYRCKRYQKIGHK
ncbi:unnamed protein product, partial [Hymenolepis diminuta]